MATPSPPSGEQSLDVDSYISSYSGHTCVQRLVFIADTVEGDLPLARHALLLAVAEVKKGENTTLYAQLVSRAQTLCGEEACPLDHAWIESVDRRAQQRQEKLETELNGYKTNLIKESIRMGHNDLGDFYYARGDLQSAFKYYVRTRDYCTTSKHIVAMCLNVIRVGIELNNYAHVTNFVQKAEATPDVQGPEVVSKLRCAAGLAALEGKKYKLAAKKFVEASADHSYDEVIAPQDVAIYGSLCALASFERSELRDKIIDNGNFRNFLELVPDVRELIADFYASKYATCLRYLQVLRTSLNLDIHLHDHVDSLYDQIRQRALIHYTIPYVSVRLNTMADAFNTSVPEIEKEIATLIMNKKVNARIDSHNKVLYARHADHRNATFEKALKIGEDYVEETHSLILRTNLMLRDMSLKKKTDHHG